MAEQAQDQQEAPQEPAQEQVEDSEEQSQDEPQEPVTPPEQDDPEPPVQEAQQDTLIKEVSTFTQLVDSVMDLADEAGWQAHVVENDQGFPPYVFTKMTDTFTGVVYAFLLDDGETMDENQARTQRILTSVGTTCHQWYPRDYAVKAAKAFV